MLPRSAWLFLLILLFALPLAGCGDAARQAEVRALLAVPVEVDNWDTLIPEDWLPEAILAQFDDEELDELGDEDPRAIALLEQLRLLWAEAPVVEALDGLGIRLPGFVVPLDFAARGMREFLLVPYYGACIHVPPPPANQTLHVVMAGETEFAGGLFDTVWVLGTLRVIATQSELADAGYRIEDARVAPYLDEIAFE